MPKLHKLFVLPQAYEDFQSILEPLRSEILSRLKTLKKFPNIGAPLGGRLEGWRATTVGLYRIYYRLISRGIEVGFIRHCKRRLPSPSSK